MKTPRACCRMLSTSAVARLAILLLLVTAAWTTSAQTAADEDLPTGIDTKSTAQPLNASPASSTVAAPASSIKAPEQQLQAQPGPSELPVSTPAAAAAAVVLKPADATPLASTPQPAGTPARTAEPQLAANTPEQPALPQPTAPAAVVPATAPAATEPTGVPATKAPEPVPASTPADAPPVPAAEQPNSSSGLPAHCPPPFDTQQYKTTTFPDNLKSTVSIHPKRPSAAVPKGGWIQVRTELPCVHNMQEPVDVMDLVQGTSHELRWRMHLSRICVGYHSHMPGCLLMCACPAGSRNPLWR